MQLVSGSGNVLSISGEHAGVIITLFTLSNGVPAILVLVLTSCIVWSLLCRNRGTLLQKDNEDQKTSTVILVAVCFLLFQLPLFIISVTFFNSKKSSSLRHLYYVAVNLIYLDTLSNCGVMLACNKNFRVLFYAQIRCLTPAQTQARLQKAKKPASSDAATGSSLLNAEKSTGVETNAV